MFAAINADADAEDTRDGGETVEAVCSRVTATYERALHALRDGARAEAQGASRDVAGHRTLITLVLRCGAHRTTEP